MKEHYLHQIWKLGLFNQTGLTTAQGNPIQIESRGEWNWDSGPDFFNSRIRLGGVLLVGNVEIHIKSSDWYRHGHQNDTAYNNTILHVVYENDMDIVMNNMETLPTLELKSLLHGGIEQGLDAFFSTLDFPVCSKHLLPGKSGIFLGMQERVLNERLAAKSQYFGTLLKQFQGDLETAFYIFQARYLGYKVNTDAMQMLAQAAPLKTLARFRDQLTLLEAYLFGQAGMLAAPKDEYMHHLKKEFDFLKSKYKQDGLSAVVWKFMRMRPSNFPTMRIAQMASWFHNNNNLFRFVIECKDAAAICSVFETEASAYWNTHYTFAKISPSHSAAMGLGAREGLLINVVVPAMCFYGELTQNKALKDRAMALLQSANAEDNQVTRVYEKYGFSNKNAYESQALLGLREKYCEKKRCLECEIGMRIISK